MTANNHNVSSAECYEHRYCGCDVKTNNLILQIRDNEFGSHNNLIEAGN